MAPEAREWVSSSEAATRLRVSEKTVWRRAKAGTLMGRKVPSDRGGFVWEISLEPTGQPTDRPDKTERPSTGQKPSADADLSVKPTRQIDRPTDRTATDHESGAVEVELRESLAREREMNNFLRGLIEQRDRDAAEMRAALRKALDNAPKQLTVGESSTNSQVATVDTSPAPQTAKMEAMREEPMPTTYAGINEMLERKMNK